MSATHDDPLSVPSPDLDLDDLLASVATHWGLTGELTPLHGERDRNFRLDFGAGRHLLKVHNPADRESVLDLQCSALRHLRSVAPDLPVPGVVPTRDGRPWVQVTGRDGRRSLAWVLTWLDGRHPEPDAVRPARVGAHQRPARAGAARLRPPGRDPSDHRGTSSACRSCGPGSQRSRRTGDRRSRRCSTASTQRVVPVLPRLRAQVVHNDLAPTNVLVDDDLALTGITDFGDLTHTALVCDLAIAAADVLSGRADGLERGERGRRRLPLASPRSSRRSSPWSPT